MRPTASYDTKLTPHKPSLRSCAWLCHQSALLPCPGRPVEFHRGPVLSGTVIHNKYCRTELREGVIRPRITSPNTNLYRRGATL